ncbi:MAG: ABC transporter permease [Burkholderiaceae bacterium]|nr:ABC transporter permease [Roseateles sp.]MBV8468345.1 ABC transporter permease [Burkholderiaceae bacterium]
MRRAVVHALYESPRLSLWLLLGPPLLWFLLVYVGPLLGLLLQSVYTFDEFSMTITREFTLANLKTVVSDPTNLDIAARSLTMSVAVTLACVALGYPLAYYMARYASGTLKPALYVAVMIPMWASYIVKAYAWTVILAKEGVVMWCVNHIGLAGLMNAVLNTPYVGGNTLSTSHLGRFIVFTYMWLPFMVLPIQASIERIPRNLLLASADLGARPGQSFRNVILPLTVPGVAAGATFTFCLTFGDFIVPTLVGPSGDFLGTAVYRYQGAIGNMPMAAALTLIPIVVVSAWLWLARRLGAFDAL